MENRLKGTEPKVLVVQQGARHNYAMPASFENLGILSDFYTDVCAGRGVGRVAELLARVPTMPSSIHRLANRTPPRSVLKKTTTFDGYGLSLQRALTLSDPIERVRAVDALEEGRGRQMSRKGFKEATHLLTMFYEGRSFLRTAKEAGVKIVSDVYIAPSAEKIFVEEQSRYPQLQDHNLIWGQTLVGSLEDFDPLRTMLETSDLLLCPSEFVRRDLVENFGVAFERTRLVPYAVHDSWFSLDRRTIPGRVLYAGTADLRKGVHYLGMAAERLEGRQGEYQFIIAGAASERMRRSEYTQSLTFLGRVPRAEMASLFAEADVFVLPSLAEGSAGVTYEALASGVPVVTTNAAGSIVRDGVDGLIVPERDPQAIADAVESIVSNRDLRDRMGAAARKRATAYSWGEFQRRLTDAVLSA